MSHQYPGINIHFSEKAVQDRVEMNLFGFWIFMMSDFIIFGLLIATYATMDNPMGQAGGPGPKELFSLPSIFIQTIILLLSALSSGWIGQNLKFEKVTSKLHWALFITWILGAAFLALELRDFADMWAQGATPMRSGWLSSYYALVGLHGFHIFVGLIWILVIALLLTKKGITERLIMRTQIFMVFWHFLDIVWVGIFTIVFLRGLA